jgi:hypothetical protein
MPQPTPDPILAAIAAHRRAYAQFVATPEPESLKDPEEWARYNACLGTLDTLIATKPATIAGAAAVLRYLLEYESDATGLLEIEGDVRGCLTTLAGALEAIAAGAG